MYSSNVKKKLNSTGSSSYRTTPSFSRSSDERYQTSLHQLEQSTMKPSKSETVRRSNAVIVPHDTTHKLKSTFIDILEGTTENDDIVDIIKSQFDAQSVRIRRLERALKEKEEEEDPETTLQHLLTKYPQSMAVYRQQIEEAEFNQQLANCIEQFELQKQRMIDEHQRNFEILKKKYRSRFDDIVERMISDPSRLDDEWARRVKQDAENRVEEMRRKLLLRK